MQALFGFFWGKNGGESFRGGIGKNRTSNILTRTSRKRKSFCFLTQSHQATKSQRKILSASSPFVPLRRGTHLLPFVVYVLTASRSIANVYTRAHLLSPAGGGKGGGIWIRAPHIPCEPYK